MATPDGAAALVRGLLSGRFRTSCTDMGPNTSSRTHTPASTSTAGCTDRPHEYLSAVQNERLHFFFFGAFSIFTHTAGPAAIPLSSTISPLINMPCSDLLRGPVASPRKAGTHPLQTLNLRNVYNIVICRLNRSEIKDVSLLRINAGLPFFSASLLFEHGNINVSSKRH